MAVVPTGTIEDHHGMGISETGLLILAEMMVHRGGFADGRIQRRPQCPPTGQTDTKQIGRGEAGDLWRHRPAAGLPIPGSSCSSADAASVLKPYLGLAHRGRLTRLGLAINCNHKSCETSACAVASARGLERGCDGANRSTLSDGSNGRCSTGCNQV